MLSLENIGQVPGVLEDVLRVKSEDATMAGYYLRMGGRLYSTRPAGTPDGPALWRLAELPAPAEAEAMAERVIGREVRRVMLCACPDDENQLAFVLDLGQQNYLQFYPLNAEQPAEKMCLTPECGEVEQKLTFAAELPLVTSVPPEMLKTQRLGVRLLGLGTVAFFVGLISIAAGVPEPSAIVVAVAGLLVLAVGMSMSKRLYTCPWCGEKAFGTGSAMGHFCCHDCGNSIDTRIAAK